ncbi:MAG: DUF4230 domain-containing protein [Proteobacteria bacterium]|nr:DUF4230 domain-containing protein [Pseudomonadota bacterium]
MEFTLIVLVFGILLGVGGAVGIRRLFKKKNSKAPVQEHQIYSFIENMKSVGELVVFKAFTKEIVTAAKHWFGDVGKRYLTWLVSNKKMAIVFEFELNFWYDLKSPDFTVIDAGDRTFSIKMPQCLYDISIRRISLYDQQKARLLPWLLPGLVSEFFGTSFNEDEHNRLMDEALKQASVMADRLINRLSSEIEKSARQNMETLAKSFGAKSVLLDFSKSQMVERSVTDVSPRQMAEA